MLFDESIPLGPRIKSSLAAAKRPLVSVMIPITNESHHLMETLHSVLSQDPGSEVMQIEIVDASGIGDLGSVIDQKFHGRVQYFRQPACVSAARNWNACIDRAQGEWVHVLLANDLVQPDFYAALRSAIVEDEHIGAFTCRYALIDGGNVWMGLSEAHARSAGVLSADFVVHQIVSQRLHLSSLVVRRDAFEENGGFQEQLRYCADWEFCNRLALTQRVFYDPRVLVYAREYEGHGRFRFVADGENVVEQRLCLRMYTELFNEEWERKLHRMGMLRAGLAALRHAQRYRANGSRDAARRQVAEALKCGAEAMRDYVEGNFIVRFIGHLVEAFRPLSIGKD